MKKLRRFLASWRLQLTLILLVFILGLIGYTVYYRDMDSSKVLTSLPVETLLSTIRLFALAFDASAAKITRPEIRLILEAARWMALLISGTALVRLVTPLFARSRSEALFHAWNRRKNRILIIGNNSENEDISRSASAEDHALVVNDTGCQPPCVGESRQGFRCVSRDALSVAVEMADQILRNPSLSGTIIINTQDERRNLVLCQSISRKIQEYIREDLNAYSELTPDRPERLEIERRVVHRLNRLQVLVWGDQRYQEIYLELQRNSGGILRYMNKYMLTACSFVFQHPLTDTVPREWIRRGALDADVECNVFFLGFGKPGRHIFSVHRTVSQFVSAGENSIPAHKKIHYYLVDPKDPETVPLRETDLRYETEFLPDIRSGRLNSRDYLPLPDSPASVQRLQMDINSSAFHDFFRSLVTSPGKAVHQVIISVGDDLENIRLAQKIETEKREWGVAHMDVFALVRDSRMESDEGGPGLPHFVSFGDQARDLFHLRMILHNPIIDMAHRRHTMYTMESFERNAVYREDGDLETHAQFTWYTMDPRKQISSLFSVLSLSFKLGLMGMYCRDARIASSSPPADHHARELVSNESYMKFYAKGDHPVFSGKRSEGMDLISYTGTDTEDDFRRNILRRNLTVQEHYRWNAYMMSQGFVPASRTQMKEKTRSDYSLRVHGNLTSFEGLFEYRRMMAEYRGTGESEEDVIKYDYQLLDEAWCFLHSGGCRIFLRDE